MFFRVLVRCVVVLAILVSTFALNYFAFHSHAAIPAPEAQHGLTGNYYLGSRGWQTDAVPPTNAFYQVWSDQNDFMLPRTFTAPAATRVDAQVAFGQGKGFHVGQKGPALIWWPTGYAIPQGWGYKEKPWEANHFVAAIWKGYIHLPKAGTYYFGTVSNGASAVYLNQARVALNGWGGGVLVSDGFSYASEQVQDFVTQNSTAKDAYLADPRFQYAVPVPVDGPRDLPIEVDYDVAKSPSNWGSVALGLDLFWVTRDSPRDANGKPTASIVPSEALYTEAPGPIEKPLVRSANSTISADYFYVAAKSDNFVTVTVRLADKDGNPVVGKRVALSSVGDTGRYRDEIVQPEKPTDAQGETAAKIHTNHVYSVGHDATLFAADVTDFVDVGQVGHITFQNVGSGSFFPDTFSPYYDPHAPEVTPTPLQVGRQVTVKMPLVNRNTYAADLEVIFEIHEFNIGASNWQEIGRVKNVRLQPGEHKDVSIQWTPTQATVHICFRVSVYATKLASVAPPPQALSATLLPVAFEQGGNAPQANDPNRAALTQPSSELAAALQTASGYSDALSGGQANGGTKQDNKEAVQPDPSPCDKYFNGDYGNRAAPFPPVTPEIARADANFLRDEIEKIKKQLDAGGLSSAQRKELDDKLTGLYGQMVCMEYIAATGAYTQGQHESKQSIQNLIAQTKEARDYAYSRWWGCTHPPNQPYEQCTSDQIIEWQQEVLFDDEVIKALQQLDPADSHYGHLAVAASDSLPAYLDALRVSHERYHGAEAAGDREWMARHFTAARLYEKRIAESLRLHAAVLEKQAQSLPPDNPETLASLQANEAKSLEIIRKGGAISSTLRRDLLAKGAQDADLRKMEAPRPDFQLPSELKPAKDTFPSFATAERSFADQWRQDSETAPTQEVTRQQGYQLSQTYAVANPHDRQETVELFIRPISIPPDWKLSIVNAEEDQAGQRASKPGSTPPKYPVHELDPGKHYNITLPAKTETKVASVVIPVGEVGARTTARWAVEGRIGNELIGGMVHEMNVPYIIPDLQLPPVGSKEVEEELPAPGRPLARVVAEIAAVIIVVGLLMFFFIFWRRRRRTTAT